LNSKAIAPLRPGAIALIYKTFLPIIMKHLVGDQLSLIAGDDFDCGDVGDWGVDTRPVQDRSILHDRATWIDRARDGEQNKKIALPVAPHRGGQNKNRSIEETCPPSLFDFKEGDPGTWVETEHRKGGDYKYLRWRECSGKKRSKYLGKVSI
jgi:hypothetical protein